MPYSHPKLTPLWFCVLILLIAFGLRVIALGDKAVWWDEAWSVWVAQADFATVTDMTARDVHPPLYQWALHIWVRIVGISEFATRSLSLFWSILTIPVVYAIGVQLNGKRAGILGMCLAGGSVFLVHWAQETRMYAQGAFFTCLAVYAYLRLITSQRTNWHIMFVMACIATALTHYLGIFVIGILNLHWLLTLKSRPRAFHVRWVVMMVVVGIILGLWALYALERTRSGSAGGEAPLLFVFELATALIAVGTSIEIGQYALITLLVTFGFAVGLGLYALQHRANALLIALFALIPPISIVLLNLLQTRFYQPQPEERYFVVFAGVVYAGMGVALHRLMDKWRMVGSMALIGLCVVYALAYLRDLNTRYYRDDYATLFRTITLLAKPDEPVFFVSDDRYPLVYYHLNRAEGWQSHLDARGVLSPEGNLQPHLMRELVGDAQHFWVVRIEQTIRDPEFLTTAWFETFATPIYAENIDYNGFTYYSLNPNTPRPSSDAVLLPPIIEARHGDVVRVGTAGDVTWQYGDMPIATDEADGWRLSQFTIYPAFPNGAYRVVIGEESATFYVTHGQTPATPDIQLDARFGDMTLLGYDVVQGTARAGDAFIVRLHWRVDAVMQENYTVFAQLLGPFRETGPVWASDDGYPADTPTTRLWAGMTFVDTYRLVVPVDMPAGTYDLAFGLYQLETGERVASSLGGDAVTLSGFVVSQ